MHLSVDVLALGSMKTAARRDIQWELQKYETHQVVERICGSGSPEPIGCRVSLKNLIPTDVDFAILLSMVRERLEGGFGCGLERGLG